MTRHRLIASLVLLVAVSSCTQIRGCGPTPEEQEISQSDPAKLNMQALPESRKTTITFLGDSLTAGLGLTSNQAFPALIGQLFAADGYPDVEIENAGISGDTTAGALRRLEQLLRPNVKILVVGLGGNDALRGLSVTQTHDNLQRIIDASLAHGTEVVLVGMEAPTNYGTDYQEAFRGTFTQLAAEYKRRITFVPFLLEGVAGMPELNQADGVHPNEQGAKIIADHLFPVIRNVVDILPSPGSTD
jgi:acyl-CoA thioesterase I